MSRNPLIYLPLAGLLILGACTIESTGGAANATKVGFDPSLPASPDANAEDYGPRWNNGPSRFASPQLSQLASKLHQH